MKTRVSGSMCLQTDIRELHMVGAVIYTAGELLMWLAF